ncbi:MAG: penicillin-binding protein 2 [Candidatus Aminicenantes bacterium]|nr:penicillin-binding protein 2 [Candidatus Aminicenantes bacterium]
MRTFYESDIRKRTLVLSFILAAWAAVVALRLVQIQVLGHARAKAVVLNQNRDKITIEPLRGRILDRYGEILACSLPAVSVNIRPVEKETPADERNKVRALQGLLGLSEKQVAYILDRLKDKRNFTYVKEKISEEDAARVMALKLPGVEFEPATRRHYPLGSRAAHILGGLSLSEYDKTGVEARYNDILKGEEGEKIVFKVRGGRDYQTQVIKSPVPGRDIVLTIDATIQYYAEKELARAVAEHGAAWGVVIVMEPFSGEILALACLPSYDVNDFPGPENARMNRAVQLSYEPGSTFKIVTAAAVLERNRVAFTDLFDCTAGAITIGGLTIHDHERFGVLSFSNVLIHSSNVGTVQFAQRLTIPEYYDTIKAFRFGTKTGIDLPREDSGLVHPPKDWNKRTSLPHIAIGYEVMATPLQILQAMNVYATGGLLVRPRVVVLDGGGEGPVRVISEKTANELVTRVFEPVVEEGTAKEGRLDGFRAAGKTGTAQKYDNALRSYARKYTASFVGFVPVEKPRLAMIVVLDEPKEGYYGGQNCAPVFRDIARQVLRYLRVPPERPLPARVLTAGLVKGERP